MKKFLRDENLQTEIMQKGYVIVPLLSDEEITHLLNELKKTLPNENNVLDVDGKVQPNAFHVTFFDSEINYKQLANDLVQDFFSPYVERLFIDYKILTGGFFVKPSGSGEIGIHKDWTFTDNFDDVNITVWCPLVDVDETNGGLFVVEGSHKLVPNIETPQTKFFFSGFENWLKEHSTFIRLKAGEVLLFDNTILHGSGKNGSEYALCS